MAQGAPPSGPRRFGTNDLVLRTVKNEGEFCNLEGGELEVNKIAVPKFALVPSKIAAEALEIG